MASDLQEGELDEERATRSIVVSNIPDNLTYKDVIIHFQKEKHGGGDVDSTRYPDPRDLSRIIITFDDPETVETAINCVQSLQGTQLNVQKYPVPVLIPEVFDIVQARMNPRAFSSSGEILDLAQLLQAEFKVEYRHSNSIDSFILSGSLQQITLCQDHLVHHVSTQNGRRTRGATSGARGTTPKVSKAEEINESVVYQTVPVIWKFINKVPKYHQQLDSIQERYNVQISGLDDGEKVRIQSLSSCTKQEFEEGCETYIDLYRMVFDGPMLSKEIVLKPGPGPDYYSAGEAVDEVQQDAPVIIHKTTARDTWLFYGEESEVKNAVKEICQMLETEDPFKKPGRRHVQKAVQVKRDDMGDSGQSKFQNNDKQQPNEASSPDDNNLSASSNGGLQEEFLTKKGFRLSVQWSDITEEQVYVIVNCNDEFLTGFLSGLPKAIVDKGGEVIRQEAKAQTKIRRVQPGQLLVTGGGKLPCSKIIHIILWNGKKGKELQKNIVHDSVLECLRRAQSKQVKSIAFPAVGTGPKAGMQPQHCITAMLNAVEKYMTENDPKKNAISDIRFILLDMTSYKVFKAELVKRYGDSRITTSGNTGRTDGTHKKTSGKEEEEDVCPICLSQFSDPINLPKCKHQFCRPCIDEAFKHNKKCPTCGTAYGVQTGNMPRGTMHASTSYMRLPGYNGYGTIEIDYHFPGGTQGPEHPNPGQRYSGASRTAYLPDSPEGREVLGLLKKAFDARQTFTIGRSVTTGMDNTVTWNDIHHKTSISGGATQFGYPDPGYLKRVKEELAAKGIS